MEILGISKIDIRKKIFLGRYNIVIDYPTLGILELTILTCLVSLSLRVSKINLNEITAKNIS